MANSNLLPDNIVILGGAGFLGSHLVELLLTETESRVTIVDNFSEALYPSKHRRDWLSGMQDRYPEALTFVEASYESPESIALCRSAGVVVNLAATAGLRKSWDSPMAILQDNFLRFNHLVESLKQAGQPIYLVHASTSSVYGVRAEGDESTARNPASPYGASKLAAELKLESISQEPSMQWVGLRFFSLYGPRQRSDMAFAKAIESVLHNTEFTVYGDGSQSRTNTYVTDAARAIILTLKARPLGEFINISGDEIGSLNEALATIEHLMNQKIRIRYSPEVSGDQRITRGNIGKAERLLGWRPETPQSEGLRQQIDQAIKNFRDSAIPSGN